MKTLSEKFQDSMGSSIEIDGKTTSPIYLAEVFEDSQILLKWVGTDSNVKQGIRLKIESGLIHVNNLESPAITLWEDTCPNEISILLKPQSPSILKIWNVWSIDGLEQAWVGNAGLTVKNENDDTVCLFCSDGLGEVDFNNLIFKISFK